MKKKVVVWHRETDKKIGLNDLVLLSVEETKLIVQWKRVELHFPIVDYYYTTTPLVPACPCACCACIPACVC